MPMLSWIGKEKVVNHHLEVSVHELRRTYSFDGSDPHSADGGSENKIIHGDSLDALKALLPQYEGRVKCIYLDPPYNTGNEGWVYNDNVNDPHIQKWLGDVVGKEGEDFSRHDKWLCMMYPRLKLVQKLLSEDGAVFISIDDNELYSLKFVCDEIFGSAGFVADIGWQRTYSTRNDAQGVVSEIEHILAYSKQPGWQPQKLPRSAEMDSKYKNPDNDPRGLWRSDNAYAPGAATHQGMVYAIQHPFTGKYLYPTNGRCWTFAQSDILDIMNGWCRYELKDIHDDDKRAEICGVSRDEVRKDILAVVLSDSREESRKAAQMVLKRGSWPRFFFSKNGEGGIARKTYRENLGGVPPTNLWPFSECGHTDEAKKEVISIFGGKAIFDTPKPTRLIERILQIASDKDSIVLDCFAGSGTTAHAVLKQNAKDGGNRRFILVEMCDYAESVTAERVKRVIKGYGEGKNAVAGTGGDFSFYEIGEPLFVGEELNPAADIEAVRDYVWFSETRTARRECGAAGVRALPECGGGGGAVGTASLNGALIESALPSGEPALLGVQFGTAYYFWHDAAEPVVLNRKLLHTIKTKAESYVIYADLCALGAAELEKFHITFKKVSRDIVRV